MIIFAHRYAPASVNAQICYCFPQRSHRCRLGAVVPCRFSPLFTINRNYPRSFGSMTSNNTNHHCIAKSLAQKGAPGNRGSSPVQLAQILCPAINAIRVIPILDQRVTPRPDSDSDQLAPAGAPLRKPVARTRFLVREIERTNCDESTLRRFECRTIRVSTS